MLLVAAVQTISSQRQVFADAIVEDSEPAPHDRLWLRRATRRPGKADTWREIVIAADVVLIFVTQPHVQSQIPTHFPVVLRIQTKVCLANGSAGIAGSQAELTGKTDPVSIKSGKRPDSVKVLSGDVGNIYVAHALAKF